MTRSTHPTSLPNTEHHTIWETSEPGAAAQSQTATAGSLRGLRALRVSGREAASLFAALAAAAGGGGGAVAAAAAAAGQAPASLWLSADPCDLPPWRLRL